MTQAKEGNTVKVHFTGTLEDGTVFATTKDSEPFEFTMGGGRVISAFEEGVAGMSVGETKDITAPPEEAFGPWREDLIMEVEKEALPEEMEAEVGQRYQVRQQDGALVNITVTDVEAEKVTIDANHPLAGKTLHFEVELVDLA